MNRMKNIGILTSGGDCPGMNTAVRAAVFAAREKGIKLFGVQQGFKGLYEGNWEELTIDKVDAIHAMGGTILRTARFMRFKNPDQLQPAIDQCIANCAGKIDGLIVIGGDGSFRGARDLTLNGLPCVCLPATIDNDISCTEYTIGYDTALNTVMTMADAIADTARSHDRCMVIEVMGNKAGDLTLYGGIACGATAVIAMEYGEFDFPEEGEMSSEEIIRFEKTLVDRLHLAKEAGKNYYLIFIAEGVTGKKDKAGKTRYPGGVEHLAQVIQTRTGIDTRADILAYMQRGGSPTARDRVMATQMGDYAVSLLASGVANRVIVSECGEIKDFDILEGLNMKKAAHPGDYELAWRVSL